MAQNLNIYYSKNHYPSNNITIKVLIEEITIKNPCSKESKIKKIKSICINIIEPLEQNKKDKKDKKKKFKR